MRIGIDIETVSRFIFNKDSKFIQDNFTKKEIEYCYMKTKPEVHLCGFFCAKEAIIKTLNKAVSMKKIEIIKKRDKPVCKIIIDQKEIGKNIKISISHTKDYAVANAIRFGKDYEKKE